MSTKKSISGLDASQRGMRDFPAACLRAPALSVASAAWIHTLCLSHNALETLDLEGMSPPSAEDGRRFGGALNLCSNLKTLLMQKVELRDETMQARHAPFHLQSSHVRRV